MGHGSHTWGVRTFAVAGGLTLLKCALGLLTAASKVDGTYQYNFATVPLLAELIKLVLSVARLLERHVNAKGGAKHSPPEMTFSLSGLSLFIIPSLLYWIHNNVQFLMLAYVDPTTFQVLSNLKIVTTGVLFRLCLHRHMTALQWIALVLLMIGTTSSQLSDDCGVGPSFIAPWQGYALGLCSALLSALGAVCTEWLLKHTNDSLSWQNVQLYGCGSIVNGMYVLLQGRAWHQVGPGLLAGYNAMTWAVVLTLALSGLVTSWIMKFADSILKVYSSTMAVALTMLISVMFFNMRMTLQLALGVSTACLSLAVYYLPPSALLRHEQPPLSPPPLAKGTL